MANNIEIIYKIQKGKVVENNIRGYIRKKGIWILFGKKTEGYECLNVAKSKNIGNEVLYDISCMQNLNYEEGAKKYINEFGEYFGLKYKEKIVVISLSVDPEAVWKKTEVKESADNWLQLSDGLGMSGIAAHYGVHALPSFIYISPESTVLKAGQGYKFLSEDIRTFIKDK